MGVIPPRVFCMPKATLIISRCRGVGLTRILTLQSSTTTTATSPSLRLFSSLLKQRHCQPVPSYLRLRFTLVRNCSNDSKFNTTSQKTILGLRMKDQIPKYYELIYRSSFGNYLLAVQALHFLLVGAVLAVIAMKGVEIMFPLTEEEVKSKLEGAKNIGFVPDQMKEEEMLIRLRNPHFEEIAEGGLPMMSFLVLALFSSIFALVKLQRSLPIRIYSGPKGHTIAIFYGHFIPLRTTRYEFLEGTLKMKPNPRQNFLNLSTYKDSRGKNIVLMEHLFRYPADLNRLMGIGKSEGEWIMEESDKRP